MYNVVEILTIYFIKMDFGGLWMEKYMGDNFQLPYLLTPLLKNLQISVRNSHYVGGTACKKLAKSDEQKNF